MAADPIPFRPPPSTPAQLIAAKTSEARALAVAGSMPEAKIYNALILAREEEE